MAQREEKSLERELVRSGMIQPEHLEQARQEAQKTGEGIPPVLARLGYVSEEDIYRFMGRQLGVSFISLTSYLIDAETIKLIPEKLARQYKLIPLFKLKDTITVAMADPLDVIAIDKIQLSTGFKVDPVISSEKDILSAIDQHYGVTGSIDEVIKTLTEETAGEELEDTSVKRLKDLAEEAPMIRLVNLLVVEGVKARASDIHLEPDEKTLRVRFRVDGVLQLFSDPPKQLQSAITTRIKIMAAMNIAEKRAPQDGRILMRMGAKEIDIRVSTQPTIFGENVVLRLLDKSSILLGLEQLGLSPAGRGIFSSLIAKPYGMILVTGPTGCGKTTTLYTALSTVNNISKNIMTIEDPVEYQLELARQTQVNPKAGVTFASGLRSILRQDPDIIMVGEVRDQETAELAIRAALTGHLVFSTLHTNDAAGALTRLTDIGIEPFLSASAVIGVVAERLVRVICPHCKESYALSREQVEQLGVPSQVDLPQEKGTFYRGKGCKKCQGTGFLGRTGIFEIMVMNNQLRQLIQEKASLDKIREAAVKGGMVTLFADGWHKVLAGITTLEEVKRVAWEI